MTSSVKLCPFCFSLLIILIHQFCPRMCCIWRISAQWKTKSKANKKLQIKGFCTKDTKQLIKASTQRGQLAFNKIWLHKHSSFSILLRRVKAVTKQNYVITTAMIQTWVQWQCYSDNVTLKCDSVRKMCYILFPFPLQFPLNYKSEKYDFYFFPL